MGLLTPNPDEFAERIVGMPVASAGTPDSRLFMRGRVMLREMGLLTPNPDEFVERIVGMPAASAGTPDSRLPRPSFSPFTATSAFLPAG